MDITALFNEDYIKKQVEQYQEAGKKAILDRLISIVDFFVKEARLRADFTDRTGNLRSSIAGAVYYDGQLMYENYQKSAKGTDRATGLAKAKSLIQTLAYEQATAGFSVIVVAGEDYAASVESKGRDVISGSSIKAVRLLRAAFKSTG